MDNELILTLDFETALRADELSELFAALARDYRDFTKGRTLVVSEVRTGSLIAHLRDLALAAAPYVPGALEFAKGAKAIADFAKLIKDWLSKARSGRAGKQLYKGGRKSPGLRSLEKMLDIAARSKSEIRIELTTSEGETIKAEMTPLEATIIRQKAEADRPKLARSAQVEKEVSSLPTSIGSITDIRKLLEPYYGTTATNPSPSEIETIVGIFLAALASAGAIHLANQIADDFDNHGLHALAAELRARLRGGGTIPPLLTSS